MSSSFADRPEGTPDYLWDMAAPDIFKMLARKGGKVVPPPATKKSAPPTKRASSKRKATPDDVNPRPSKAPSSDKAIPISSEDALTARLSQLKLDDDSILGTASASALGFYEMLSTSDRRFLRSMEIPLLADFGVHKTVQVSDVALVIFRFCIYFSNLS